MRSLSLLEAFVGVKGIALGLMMMPPSQPGRRTYLIDRGFQLKYSLLMGAAGGLVSALFGVMIFLAHQDAVRHVQPGTAAAVELAQVTTTLIWLMAGTCILMSVSLALLGVLITHRVAGPVYVMNHYLTVMASGRFPKMRPLRKNDELKHFFGGLQSTIEYLRKRESEDVEALERVIQEVETFAPVAVVEALKALRDKKLQSVSPGQTASGGAAGAAPLPPELRPPAVRN